MVDDGYFWLEIGSLVLLMSALVILLKAKRRDITHFLKNKLAGIFLLVGVFLIVFIIGFFISALSVLAFLVSFVLLLIGFVFSKSVEIRRGIRLFRGKLEEESINPKVDEIKKERGDIEKEKNHLEKERSKLEEFKLKLDNERKNIESKEHGADFKAAGKI